MSTTSEMKLLFFSILFMMMNIFCCQNLPYVLPPIYEVGDEVAILIVPGAYINAAMYQPLGEALQNATSLRLWVGLVGPFTSDFPNPAQCGKDIEATLALMREMGMTTNLIYLSGHSLGGVVMQGWGWDHQDQISGFILMASVLNLDSLANATLPVMHISGDLDGMVTAAEAAPVYKELQTLVTTNNDNKLRFPVVILENVNHMHFASGSPPPAVVAGDILSPLAEETAHKIIAFHMVAFMTAIDSVPTNDVEEATLSLQFAYDNTGYIMKPFFEMVDFTDTGSFSRWSMEAQIVMSSIEAEYEARLNVTDTILPMEELELIRPTIIVIGEDAYVNTYTNVRYPSLIEQEEQVTANQMAVKFKSQEAVMEMLIPFGVPFINGNSSCQLVNQVGMNKALSSATPLQLSRYYARGKSIIFENDDEKTTGQGWVNTDISYVANGTNLLVTSSSLHTDVSLGIGELGGVHYCKLMPPARMMEYIMIDSLRETVP